MNKPLTLAGLIGHMRARRIIKKYFSEEYPNPDDIIDNAAAIPMADSLSDAELLAINGVGLMCVQSIRRACEEKPDIIPRAPRFGLMVDEDTVINLLADAWNAFLKLPELHAEDTPDFRKAIHDAQRIIQSRPALKP